MGKSEVVICPLPSNIIIIKTYGSRRLCCNFPPTFLPWPPSITCFLGGICLTGGTGQGLLGQTWPLSIQHPVMKPELLQGTERCVTVCSTLLALLCQEIARDREPVINSVETDDKQFEKSMCSVNSAASPKIGSPKPELWDSHSTMSPCSDSQISEWCWRTEVWGRFYTFL